MKYLNVISKITLITIFTFTLYSCTSQKEKLERENLIVKMVNADNFKFVAQQANPLRAGFISQQLRQLDGFYYLKIRKDTIQSYLPYFGVAQQAPYGSNDNGISFTSTDFTYTKTTGTKGDYLISIIPKNEQKASKLYLTITKSGSATLNVTSNLRDAISFSGDIQEK